MRGEAQVVLGLARRRVARLEKRPAREERAGENARRADQRATARPAGKRVQRKAGERERDREAEPSLVRLRPLALPQRSIDAFLAMLARRGIARRPVRQRGGARGFLQSRLLRKEHQRGGAGSEGRRSELGPERARRAGPERRGRRGEERGRVARHAGAGERRGDLGHSLYLWNEREGAEGAERR